MGRQGYTGRSLPVCRCHPRSARTTRMTDRSVRSVWKIPRTPPAAEPQHWHGSQRVTHDTKGTRFIPCIPYPGGNRLGRKSTRILLVLKASDSFVVKLSRSFQSSVQPLMSPFQLRAGRLSFPILGPSQPSVLSINISDQSALVVY